MTHTHAHTHAHTRTHTRTHPHTPTHTHTHTYTRIHTHTHTHFYFCLFFCVFVLRPYRPRRPAADPSRTTGRRRTGHAVHRRRPRNAQARGMCTRGHQPPPAMPGRHEREERRGRKKRIGDGEAVPGNKLPGPPGRRRATPPRHDSPRELDAQAEPT